MSIGIKPKSSNNISTMCTNVCVWWIFTCMCVYMYLYIYMIDVYIYKIYVFILFCCIQPMSLFYFVPVLEL